MTRGKGDHIVKRWKPGWAAWLFFSICMFSAPVYTSQRQNTKPADLSNPCYDSVPETEPRLAHALPSLLVLAIFCAGPVAHTVLSDICTFYPCVYNLVGPSLPSTPFKEAKQEMHFTFLNGKVSIDFNISFL